jgi:hypothetical protein
VLVYCGGQEADVKSPAEIASFVAEAAGHAPAIYGQAPWWFSAGDRELTVHADTERQQRAVDPVARELTISCGAAVLTARLALRYLGCQPQVQVLPDRPELVARISWPAELKPASEFERGLFDQVALRRPPAGPFGRRPLPPELMASLLTGASHEHASLRPMADDDERSALLAVADAASCAVQLRNARAAVTDPAGPAPDPEPPFLAEPPVAGETAQLKSARVSAILSTSADDRTAWIAAGQALQLVLLVAASHGVQVAVDGTATEFPSLRDFLRTELVDGAYPQLVLAFGLPA